MSPEYLFKLWLAVTLIACAVFTTLLVTDPTTKVQTGTFNLGFFTDLDRSTGGRCESNNHRGLEEIRELASFVDSLDIEVLALQEVENEEAMELLLSFLPGGKYGYILSRQSEPRTCQKVAVLYQRGEIGLSLGWFGLRDGLVVAGRFLPAGFDFTLVVVHLQAAFDSRSRGIRRRQLESLGEWVSEYLVTQGNDPDLILAGDFNEHLLTSQSAFSLLDQGAGLYLVTQDVPNRLCSPAGHSWTNPVDHIVISPAAGLAYLGTAVLDNFFTDTSLPGRWSYSDHRVLWGDFDLADLDPPALR